ncbi:hypothetical protein AB0K89_04650 [Streptomyces cinnamoneus]|uniref:hypothetical protein n=1 Tax=Streptomyces cinnamoneus TaxID=53446 RepID=UPI003441358D
MPIEEFPIDQTGGTKVPHSITVGPNRWLWVTTDNNAIVQISRSDPTAQTVHTDLIPQYTAGIIKDPTDRKVVWFASPAGPQDYDPIYEFDVDRRKVINKHNLQDDARAQTISSVRFKTSEDPSSPVKDYILFAEPVHTNVGFVEVGQDGANYHTIPTGTDEFNTWLWSVAATVNDPDQPTKYTYWVTGQAHDTPYRKTNGLYWFTPADEGAQWRRIPLPSGGSGSQVPIHVISGIIQEGTAKNPYLWISARNPNQILRYDIRNRSWKTSSNINGEPRQLAFGPDGNIWVAGTDKIYCFEKDVSRPPLPTPALPSGSEAYGICIDENDQVIWYTNRKASKIGKYPIPSGSKSFFGKTQMLVQPVKSITPGSVAEVPFIAEFMAAASPTPGIPLTCRIASQEATFLDGRRECVIETDWTGQVAFPAVQAGKVEEDVVLKIGWGDNEPPTSVILNVRNEPEDDEA